MPWEKGESVKRLTIAVAVANIRLYTHKEQEEARKGEKT
jgi:hypothetical protein